MAYRLGENEEFRRLFVNILRHLSLRSVHDKPIVAIDGRLLITVNNGDIFELIVHEVCCRNVDPSALSDCIHPDETAWGSSVWTDDVNESVVNQDTITDVEFREDRNNLDGVDTLISESEKSIVFDHLVPAENVGEVIQNGYNLNDVILWDIVLPEKVPLGSEKQQRAFKRTCKVTESNSETDRRSIFSQRNVSRTRHSVRRQNNSGHLSSLGETVTEHNYSVECPAKNVTVTVCSSKARPKTKAKDPIDVMVPKRKKYARVDPSKRVTIPMGVSEVYGFFNRNKYNMAHKKGNYLRTSEKLKQLYESNREFASISDPGYASKVTFADFRNKHVCSRCPDQLFGSKSEQSHHWYLHHNLFRCRECDIEIIGRIAFNEHCIQTHPGVSRHALCKKLICEYCCEPFMLKKHLDDHIATRHYGHVHYCDDCNKQFCSSETLRLHMRQVHDPNNRQTCDVCGRQFSRSSEFLWHVRTQHPHRLTEDQLQVIARLLVCTQCGAEFRFQSSLDRHVAQGHRRKKKKKDYRNVRKPGTFVV